MEFWCGSRVLTGYSVQKYKKSVYLHSFFLKLKSRRIMKINQLKWAMCLTAFLWVTGAMAQSKVTLTFQDASTQTIEVSSSGKIYFSDNYMFIDYGTALPYTFSVSNIRNMVFDEVLGIHDIVTETFKVYPNPVYNTLYFSSNDFEVHPYSLFSIDGRLLLYGEVRNGDPISVSGIPAGLYLLKINNTSLKINKL